MRVVRQISSSVAMGIVVKHHYSHRKVGSLASFGLFGDPSPLADCLGCIVYSVPASYTLCNSVCGKDYRKQVLELSRLVVLTEDKNAASFLIGRSLKMLGNHVVVSYADCNDHVGHVGYVYQATNWLYTGRGNAEPKWVHPHTGEVVSYTRRHIDRKAEALGMDWRDLVKVPQVGKHRYVTFAGDRGFRKKARAALKYKTDCYPKGDTKRHLLIEESISAK